MLRQGHYRVSEQEPQQEHQKVQRQAHDAAHQQARNQAHRQVQNQVHHEVHPSTLTPDAALAPLSRSCHAAPTPPPHCSNAAPTQQQLALTPPASSRRSHAALELPCCNAAPTPSPHRSNAAITVPTPSSLSPRPPPPLLHHRSSLHAAARCTRTALTPPQRST